MIRSPAHRRARVEALRERLRGEDLAALLVFDLTNIRYLCGFAGSSAVLLVTSDETVLFSDFRYRLRVAEESPEVRYVELENRLADALPTELRDVEGTLGVEETALTLERWHSLESSLEKREHRLVGGLVEKLRVIKDPGEQEALRRSGALLSDTMRSLQELVVAGRPERDVALDLEMFARRRGSGRVPFDYIVAAGSRGAAPHAEASDRLIERNTLLVVDIGVVVDGYATDMTRTFAVGEPGEETRRIYEIVRRAQEKARTAAGPGRKCAELDALAREEISEAGYGAYFGHGLGHGVGLEVHEAPRVSRTSEETLEEGMAVTIEPGIYVPGLGGVRIEDTVLITASGAEVLTSFPHELVRLSAGSD